MADLETAEQVLRAFKRDVTQAPEGFLVNARQQQIQILVKNDDLDLYLSRRSALRKDTETQIWCAGYYEHVVQFEGGNYRRSFPRSEDDLVISSNDGTKIEIGRPSPLFCLGITDSDEFSRSLRRFAVPGMAFYRNGAEPKSLSDYFRFQTIKVTADPESNLGRNLGRMHDLAEAAIFHFAYGKGIPISFTRSWERTYYWLGRKENEDVQFPLRTYKSELVGYYNLALASDSLVLGYLALYKILEYFYTSVSEDALHSKIKEQLVSPDFSHTKTKKLRDLVKAVRGFDARLDEAAALKLVLSTYFEKSDLRQWIQEYETRNGSYFTVDVEVFHSKMRVDVSDSSIIPNIASRIYNIRNALVHNKEGEIARFIPYTGQEEALHKEVQILVYLAEQIIIKTGKDIT